MAALEQFGQEQLRETGKSTQRTVEQIQAEIEAMDPWGDDVEKIEALEQEKSALEKAQAEAKVAQTREVQAMAQSALEAQMKDEARAAALAEQITQGKLGEGKVQEIPSDAEIEKLYMGTVAYDSTGAVSSLDDNIRHSTSAMYKILAHNIENVALVPPPMLRQPVFQKLLKQQYEIYKPGGNFEIFFRAVSDPEYGLNQGEPKKWQERTPEDITRRTQSATKETQEMATQRNMGSQEFARKLNEAIARMEELETA